MTRRTNKGGKTYRFSFAAGLAVGAATLSMASCEKRDDVNVNVTHVPETATQPEPEGPPKNVNVVYVAETTGSADAGNADLGSEDDAEPADESE